MTLYIPHSIFHLVRLLYVRPENFGPHYVHVSCFKTESNAEIQILQQRYILPCVLGFAT